MNYPCSRNGNFADALDSMLTALRADPAFWQSSCETALQGMLYNVEALLINTLVALYQIDDDQQPRCLFPPNSAALVIDDLISSLRTPIHLRGALWGELIYSRPQSCEWSTDERHGALQITNLIAQLLLQQNTTFADKTFLGLAEDAPVAILQLDENRRVVYRNQRLIDLIGHDYTTIDDELLSRLIIPTGEGSLGSDTEILNRVGQLQRTYQIVREDGRVRHMLWHVIRERRSTFNGARFGRVGIGVDISTLWQTQQQLHAMTVQQSAILDNAAHAIIATDANDIITLFNAAAERLLGYTAAEVLGQKARIFHDSQELAQILGTLRDLNFVENISGFVDEAKQDGTETEWTYIHKDGTRIPVAISTTAVRDACGKKWGYMGMVVDLRERERMRAATEQEAILIKHISRGINAAVGEQFFEHLIAELRQALKLDHLNIVELIPNSKRLLGRLLTEGNYVAQGNILDLTGTPLDAALRYGACVHLSDVQKHYPTRMIHAYELIALPLIASDGKILGALVTAHGRAIPESLRVKNLLEIFAVRATTELERLRNELAQRMREAEQRWLYTAAETIHARHTVIEVAEETCRALTAHHSAPRVSVSLNEGELFRILAYSGPIDKAPQQNAYQRLDGLLGPMVSSKSSILLLPNFLEITRGSDSSAEFIARDIQGMAVIGLIENGMDIGAVTLEYSDSSILDQLNQDVLGTFGRAVTLALGRALHRETLEYQASHDALTGLFNRAALHREFQQWQNSGDTTALLLLDLDHFKDVNDTFGHHVGDGLLRQVGERLRIELDACPAKLTRLGGDEFAILLLHKTLVVETARDLAQRIQNAIRKPFQVNGINLEIGASIGVALYPQHGVDSHSLLRSADVAMYEIKRAGGGVSVYNANFDLNSPERLALINDFSNGIRNRQINLYYQPKINLRSGKVTGFEGLLRWRHPQLGLLSPGKLLPLIEMSDAIHDLTRSVLDEAFAQLNAWRLAGKNWELSINLSARNLIDDRVVRHLAELMHEYALPPARLQLEITEAALIKDPHRALELLARIAALGVSLTIDDFGSGYSSLSYLQQMPIAALKIDHTFIRDMIANPNDKLIVASIIQLAHSLELRVIAEGVECAETAAQLCAMDCDEAQGFHYTPALPLDELTGWLVARAQ